jgi:clan AA aspartic protease (TIGR02281 family)
MRFFLFVLALCGTVGAANAASDAEMKALILGGWTFSSGSDCGSGSLVFSADGTFTSLGDDGFGDTGKYSISNGQLSGTMDDKSPMPTVTITFQGNDTLFFRLLFQTQADADELHRCPTQTVTIAGDSHGAFRTPVTIDGKVFNFLVDTSASSVSLTADTAKSLGISLQPSAYAIATANGSTKSAPVMLPEVQVGSIRMSNVSAIVGQEGAPGENVVGANFLSRLSKFTVSGGQLTLTQ